MAPATPCIGLDHIGLREDDIDVAVAELHRCGAMGPKEPVTIEPGGIELLQRTVIEVSAAAG